MDMNDKDWDEGEEFWDNEIEEDDEDGYNGHGGNVDANNDETFDNAAEWNEDEHEELIARDMILSHAQQRGGRNNDINNYINNLSSNNNNNNNDNHTSSSGSARHDRSTEIGSTNNFASSIPSIFAQPRILTVDELERQLLKTRINLNEQQPHVPKPQIEPSKRAGWSPFSGRGLFTTDYRFHRHTRELADSREQYRDRRDNNKNHRDHHKYHKKEPIIIPPQVQLSVIEEAKRRHSITVMHPDEFLRDRMPAPGAGFNFVRHSKVASLKVNHDGVLTDKERNWLTRIQKKIQADYDDIIDQDYYYLLYFNRSSMTARMNEAAQKPSGPGVYDRRFIPRERLLYNSGI